MWCGNKVTLNLAWGCENRSGCFLLVTAARVVWTGWDSWMMLSECTELVRILPTHLSMLDFLYTTVLIHF